MNGKTLLLVGLSATLLIGGAVQASFAAAEGHHAMGGHGGRWHRSAFSPEVAYVRMLKQFDTNGDMKISKDEVKTGVDKIFDEVDTNKDGQVTPAEVKAYRQERMKQWRAEHAKAKGDDAAKSDQAQGNDEAQGNDQAQADNNGGKGHHRGHNPRARFVREAAMIRGMLLFHRIDADGNGQISKQEAEDAASKFVDRLDRNHDGVISLDDMPNRPLL